MCKQCLKKTDVQDILQVSQRTVNRILQKGDLPFFRINGRQIRIKPEDLIAYMAKLAN